MDYIMMIFKAMFVTAIFAALLFLAYVTTRFIGGKAKTTMASRNMKVMETINLGMDKRIYLVKAGDKHILLASCGKSIVYLTELKLEEQAEKEQVPESNDSFSAYLLKYVENLKNGVPKPSGKKDVTMRSNLDRLKNITSKIDIKVKNDDYEADKKLDH